MDLTAEFYLQTRDTVFMRHLLSIGLMTSHHRPVRLADVNRPALMMIEGEMDVATGADNSNVATHRVLSFDHDGWCNATCSGN